MKLLAVTDIHQMISKWKSLVKINNQEQPDVMAIAGDLFPKDTYITGQMPFMKHLVKYATKIRENDTEIVIILGNDDNQNLIPAMEQGDKDGLWHYIPEKTVKIHGYEFAAMPWVPDYPFGYKYWCRGEFPDYLRIDPQQFTKPVLVNSKNEFEVIEDYKKYLMGKKTIWQSLNDTAIQVKDINKSIWLIHCPPALVNLDVCSHGGKVGSNAVLKFIKEQQPLLTIHGHIHESPAFNNKQWKHKEGNTLCIQAGQMGMDLYYTMIEFQDGVLINSKHSIYGE